MLPENISSGTASDLAFLLRKEQPEQRRLSKAAIETLSIIAYHQPVTRAEIEDIRGVLMSKGTIDTLMEVGWVKIRGRKRTPGRPVTYGTTEAFLVQFGLESVTHLPGVDELKAAGFLEAMPPSGSRRLPPQRCADRPTRIPIPARNRRTFLPAAPIWTKRSNTGVTAYTPVGHRSAGCYGDSAICFILATPAMKRSVRCLRLAAWASGRGQRRLIIEQGVDDLAVTGIDRLYRQIAVVKDGRGRLGISIGIFGLGDQDLIDASPGGEMPDGADIASAGRDLTRKPQPILDGAIIADPVPGLVR